MSEGKGRLYVDPEKRTIVLKGEITEKLHKQVESVLKKLDKKSEIKQEPISFFINNSCGGDFIAAIGIFHAIRNCCAVIKTIACGEVKSGAFIILQAGDVRAAAKNSRLVFHKACAQSSKVFNFNSDALLKEVEKLLRADTLQIYIFTSKGRPVGKIVSFFRQEASLTAAEALHYKLIDKIWTKKIPRLK